MSKSFRQDLTGKRFGRLTVLEFVPNDKPHSYWKCKCDCGNIVITNAQSLKSADTKSCGCWQREMTIVKKTKYGESRTRLYQVWNKMKYRCNNSNATGYKNYGGRGISVCEEWEKDFNAFKEWALKNGYNDNLTIDRIDVNCNYTPVNCRFVDKATQSKNRRNNIVVDFQGKKMCLAEAAKLSGISKGTLRNRYYAGDKGDKLFRNKIK